MTTQQNCMHDYQLLISCKMACRTCIIRKVTLLFRLGYNSRGCNVLLGFLSACLIRLSYLCLCACLQVKSLEYVYKLLPISCWRIEPGMFCQMTVSRPRLLFNQEHAQQCVCSSASTLERESIGPSRLPNYTALMTIY